jgi:hypothetical protein
MECLNPSIVGENAERERSWKEASKKVDEGKRKVLIFLKCRREMKEKRKAENSSSESSNSDSDSSSDSEDEKKEKKKKKSKKFYWSVA